MANDHEESLSIHSYYSSLVNQYFQGLSVLPGNQNFPQPYHTHTKFSLLTLTLLYITKPHKNYLQNTQHVVLRNRQLPYL